MFVAKNMIKFGGKYYRPSEHVPDEIAVQFGELVIDTTPKPEPKQLSRKERQARETAWKKAGIRVAGKG
jgi:hypothetical protein